MDNYMTVSKTDIDTFYNKSFFFSSAELLVSLIISLFTLHVCFMKPIILIILL